MASIRTSRRPNHFFKGKDYLSSLKIKDQSDRKCFEIVGRKIQLHQRGGRASSNQFCTEASNLDLERIHTQHCEDDDIECRSTTSTNNEYGVLVDEEMLSKSHDDANCEAIRDETNGYPTSPIRQVSPDENKSQGVLKSSTKKRPHIKISLPTIQTNKAEEELDENSLFKEKTYMVCQQSPSYATNWQTTCVTFPDETWKLERRKLSPRNSSFSSSVSFSYARLDLACKTPDTSLMSTPIDGDNFVFPHL